MLFFRCCTICDGDLLLEADSKEAKLKCLRCDYSAAISADTHLFDVLCDGEARTSSAQAA